MMGIVLGVMLGGLIPSSLAALIFGPARDR